jgi:hypothetical protein
VGVTTRPRRPADRYDENAYLFSAIRPARGPRVAERRHPKPCNSERDIAAHANARAAVFRNTPATFASSSVLGARSNCLPPGLIRRIEDHGADLANHN